MSSNFCELESSHVIWVLGVQCQGGEQELTLMSPPLPPDLLLCSTALAPRQHCHGRMPGATACTPLRASMSGSVAQLAADARTYSSGSLIFELGRSARKADTASLSFASASECNVGPSPSSGDGAFIVLTAVPIPPPFGLLPSLSQIPSTLSSDAPSTDEGGTGAAPSFQPSCSATVLYRSSAAAPSL